jgi:beta-phosphoglucomutase-like phosphatase (HAD superfamily)
MAIASSAIRRDINIFLDELTTLRTYFPKERIVAYEDIPQGLGKPYPEPFNRAFATLGLANEHRRNVIAFEDDPRGVQSAKRAGMFVCAITTRFAADHPELLAAEPDVIIESYEQATLLLK